MVELSSQQKIRLEEIRKEHRIILVLAYGSKVKGKRHAGSDLDIGILLKDSSGSRLDLLADLWEVFPEEEVDVAILNRADPLLLKEILDNHLLLAGDAAGLQEFRIYAFKRYIEYRPFFALEAMTNERHLKVLCHAAQS